MGEIGEMATPFLREVLPSAVTISPEPLDIGGFLTTQNVRDGHIIGVCVCVCVCVGGGGSVIHFHIQKSMVFKIIAKNRLQHVTHHNYTIPPRPQHMYDTLSYCPCCTFCILFLFWNLLIWISTLFAFTTKRHTLCSFLCKCTFRYSYTMLGICMEGAGHRACTILAVTLVLCQHRLLHTHTGVYLVG